MVTYLIADKDRLVSSKMIGLGPVVNSDIDMLPGCRFDPVQYDIYAIHKKDMKKAVTIRASLIISLAIIMLTACGDTPWNSPYPKEDAKKAIYYDSFSERPKHLDPALSYSSNEYVFLGQIYEPPLQYHFLKRPYELAPLTATTIPSPVYRDARGNRLTADAPASEVASVSYRITIKPGILYQPHPALARDATGQYRYHRLTADILADIYTLSDFPKTGTRELVAADYVYQIKRLAHPKIHSPITSLMMEYIDGLATLSQQLADISATGEPIDLNEYRLTGARSIDKYTYEILLKKKYPQFIYWLSMPFFAPIPWEAVHFYQQAGMIEHNISLDWHPIGTGPYMLTENNPNRRMVLQKNPHFRGEPYPHQGEEGDAPLLQDKNKIMPFIDTAIYSLEKESIPAWNKFLQGYYDTSGILSDSFDQAITFGANGRMQLTQLMHDKGIRLSTATTTSTYYMGFNMLDELVGGNSERARLLRRAISIAVDYEEYITIFANGRGRAAQGPIPPGLFGHQGEINPYVYREENGKPLRRSIDTAMALLTEAGYPAGLDPNTGQPLILGLDTPAAGPGSKAVFDWLRKQFAKLGINLLIRATDYNRFQEKMRTGTAQIFQWGWNADYPDPENFLFLLYGPNAKVGNGGENAANYNNEEFNTLFEQMQNMPNNEQRLALINDMVLIVRRDAPWLWGFHPIGFALHHSWYKNAKPNLMAHNTLKYKRIDPHLRQQLRKQWNQPVWQPILLMLLMLIAIAIATRAYHKRREHASIT